MQYTINVCDKEIDVNIIYYYQDDCFDYEIVNNVEISEDETALLEIKLSEINFKERVQDEKYYI